MKPFCPLSIILLFLFYGTSVKSQIVSVSGQCITDTIVLAPAGDVDGKPAYLGTGTVDGNADIEVSIFWMPNPDNIWVLAFSGQPFFQTTCNFDEPPATGGVCSWTPVVNQTCAGAESLVIDGTATTLPLKITSFTARKKDKEVVLNWATANEINNRGFEIQRSANGIRWTQIGFVNGSTNSSLAKDYRFSDAYPLPGKNLYRLLQRDMDNRATYSFIVSVNFLRSGFYSISNNPGKGLYTLHIEAGTERVDFSVIDAGGRKILSKINNTGDQTIDITNSPSGIYLLQIQKGTGLFTERLIKL